MIEQLNVFLENQKGRLGSMTRAISEAGVNMHALIIADTSDYGVVRIICDAPVKAAQTLTQKGYRANRTKVLAVRTPNTPGGFSMILEALDKADVNIEYAYVFGTPDQYAVSVLKVRDIQHATDVLVESGFTILKDSDLYAPDAL